MMIAREKANKITATLKLVVTEEFYDDEASEETLRTYVEQCLEEAGLSVEVGLFKVQEPRVLALEELEDWRNAIWFEEKGEYPFLALIRKYYMDDELSIIDAHCYGKITNHDISVYSKWWRCWSARPTDEQREAVPWKE